MRRVALGHITNNERGASALIWAPANFREIDFVAVVHAAVTVHQRIASDKRIEITKDLPESIMGSAHPGQMLQVMSNLMANALEALPKDGAFSLRLRKRGDSIHFVISDNGVGIGQEHVKKIFDPFFSTKGAKGTGLRLALSKRIIERHGGKIRFRTSVRPGKSGTTFKFTLPTNR
jgi:signal transduction histidine kinase